MLPKLIITINQQETIHEVNLRQGSSRNQRFRLLCHGIRSRLLHCRSGMLRWHAALLLVGSSR